MIYKGSKTGLAPAHFFLLRALRKGGCCTSAA